MHKLPGWGARVAPFAVLIVALAETAARAPALATALRESGVGGDWRTPVGSALFDLPSYLYQSGYGHVFADGIGVEADLADPALARARAERARTLFRGALGHAPADAYAWSGLAWAEAQLGDGDAAWRALAQSYAFAPHNLELSTERVALADLLLAGGGIATAGAPAAALCADYAKAAATTGAAAVAALAPGLAAACGET